MNNDVLQFLAKAKEISLTKDEQHALLREVMEFAKEHPIDVPQQEFSAQNTEVHLSREEKKESLQQLKKFIAEHPRVPVEPEPIHISLRDIYASFLTWRLPALAMSAVLLATAGGGLAWAAEDALPDEVLYPIKIHVNERIRGWVRVSPERKADWENQKLSRRLSEFEELSRRKRMPENMIKKIEQKVAEHLENVEERMAALPEELQQERDEELSRILKNHERVLSALGDTPEHVLPIIRAVQKHHMMIEREQRNRIQEMEIFREELLIRSSLSSVSSKRSSSSSKDSSSSSASSEHSSETPLQPQRPEWIPLIKRIEEPRSRMSSESSNSSHSSGLIHFRSKLLEDNGIEVQIQSRTRSHTSIDITLSSSASPETLYKEEKTDSREDGTR